MHNAAAARRRSAVDHPDRAVARIAARQHGVVTREQLLAAGLTRRAIDRRLAAGRLHLLHRRVYAVGHPPVSTEGHDLAAVLAIGPGSALSHHHAAADMRLLPRPEGPIHVSHPGARHRRSPGIVLHRPTSLPPTDVVIRGGIPVTTAARTLLDLARTATDRDLQVALNEAQVHRLITRDALRARATGRLRAFLDDDSGFTRSEAERILLRLIARSGLPRPHTNVRLGRWEVDALWPGHRLVAEFDGYGAHATRAAFERDRVKDADLQFARYRVLRITWRQLTRQPEAVIARLAAAISSPP